MDTNSEPDALQSRWTLEGTIPLSGVAEDAVWRRARSVATGQDVVLFIVKGEAAPEAADAVRRAYLVEDPHLLPVQEIVVLDDPREDESGQGPGTETEGPTTVVEYPRPPAPPLAALLSRGPLHPETARAIIGEAATGLEAARRRGVRHQLIDSNRLFVDTRTGTVTILGIGVEAAAHTGMDRSRELASFQDTAALVALLYRALTGRSPHHDAGGDVPRPSTVVDTEIPEDLDLLCDLVLNESADDIPETTRELIEALEPWQSIPVTLEAYPRSADSSVPAPHAPEEVTAPQEEPAPAPSAASAEADAEIEAETTDEDELESTALMDAVPEEPAARTPAPGDPAAPQLPAAAGAASTVGIAGAGVAAAGATSGEPSLQEGREEPDVPGEPGDPGEPRDASPDVAAEAAADSEDEAAAAAQRAAEEKRRRTAGEAKALVTDLHLDEKRSSSAFPGHLDVTLPVKEEPEAETDSPPADAIPSRSSGVHWPLAEDAEQGEHTALSPTRSPEGSQGRPQQPSDGTPEPATASTPGRSAPTPSHPVVHSAGSQSPSPVAVTGRTVPIAPVPEDGPIVVHGRGRSMMDAPQQEGTGSSSRSSLLRDVVGVAVDADSPETFAMGPRDREKRSLQSQWIIIGGAIVVMVALVIALTSITRDLGGLLEDPLATSAPPTAAPTEEDTGEAPVEPTEEATEEPELPAAELDGVELFVQGSEDEPDNADQQDRMADGDPGTFWSTKFYGSPQYGGLKEGVGVRLNFAEPSTFSAVTVTTARNNGGTIELRALNDDGSLGDVLASGQLAGDGDVRLEAPEPIEAESVALWLPELAPDSKEQGKFRARIAEIQVE